MADTTYEHYTHEFNSNWITRAQQVLSRTQPYVDWQMGTFKGERKRFSRVGEQTAVRKTERKAPTLANNPSTDFRWIQREAYNITNDLDEDDADLLGELVLPTGAWTKGHSAAYNRLCDSELVRLALGNVIVGENGDSTSALPAAQQIAAGGTGLTLAKLRSANEILQDAELEGAEMDGEGATNRVIFYTAQQVNNLLADSTLTSNDFNTVRALVAGQVDTFMGFKFVRLKKSLIPKTSTTRSCVAIVRGAMIGGKGSMKARIATRHDKSDTIVLRSTFYLGYARLHDAGVVQIDCTES